MRPRLIAVDDLAQRLAHGLDRIASMRPRLIAVDDRLGILSDDVGELASMRPRLIAVDDPTLRGKPSRPSGCFNEATADRRG